MVVIVEGNVDGQRPAKENQPDIGLYGDKNRLVAVVAVCLHSKKQRQ